MGQYVEKKAPQKNLIGEAPRLQEQNKPQCFQCGSTIKVDLFSDKQIAFRGGKPFYPREKTICGNCGSLWYPAPGYTGKTIEEIDVWKIEEHPWALVFVVIASIFALYQSIVGG